MPSASVIANAAKTVILDALDQNQSVDANEYKKKLKEYQLSMLKTQLKIAKTKRSIILVFEGPDAAGKGGAIKRVTERLDPRWYRVYSIVKPTAEEYQHHYMWRFWNKLPKYGELVVFDRSWYGRLLVERVEGFAKTEEWQRAYREINEFERTLSDDGAIIIKLYIHISKDEQLERFKSREADPYKYWKISDEDWRNRNKWDEHNQSAQDVFAKTSTKIAPWNVIAGNFKWHARLKTLKTIVRRLETEGLVE